VRIKVLSYNIYHGENMNGGSNLQMVARIIRSIDPDIVAFQEVDSCTTRSGGIDIAKVLGKLTRMNHIFGKAMEFQGGGYGEAILSRYPILESVNHLLPASPEHEPRAALEVTIEISPGEKLRFIGTHLDHTRDSEDRKLQARTINKKIFSGGELPLIIAGDLNARPGSETIDIFLKNWIDATDGKALYNTAQESRRGRIDYIMYHPEDSWKVIEYRVIDEKDASDHNPVFVVFEYQ
jgi:endonuclease/exonuclease/phosphatase family metal-dependent hydrolase